MNAAYTLIRSNPHPTLYRRICFHLFEAEKQNPKLRIEYLLETQSIALRHKACSIQIKNKRKLNINVSLYEKITSSLSFNSSVAGHDFLNKIEKQLPSSCVASALVLVDAKTLYVIRLEKGEEAFLFKLKYSQKYSDEFKQIIAENDRSMKQSERLKFWTSRNLLNSKLAAFSESLDKNVLSFAKGMLLGSFTNFDLNRFIEKLKKELKLSLTTEQLHLLKVMLIGLEHLDLQEMREGLCTEFQETEALLQYLSVNKVNLTGLPRKHVCLLVDKVCFFLYLN